MTKKVNTENLHGFTHWDLATLTASLSKRLLSWLCQLIRYCCKTLCFWRVGEGWLAHYSIIGLRCMILSIGVSVYILQATLLLLFNTSDRLSYSEIMTQSNLTHDDLVRLLHSLSCNKYKILIKEPNTKTVSQTDRFEFNHKFTDRMRRIKVWDFLKTLTIRMAFLLRFSAFEVLLLFCFHWK